MIDEAKTQITDMMDCFLSFQLSYILRESHTELSQMLEESFQSMDSFLLLNFKTFSMRGTKTFISAFIPR